MMDAQRRARRAGSALAVVLTMAALLATTSACTSNGLDSLRGKPRSPEEAIHIRPDDAGRAVRPDQDLEVGVASGRLESVKVVKSRGAREFRVPGRIEADGMTWRPDGDGRLSPATAYTVHAVALDGHGRRLVRHVGFRTYGPGERLIGRVTPEHRSTVGTGMIVSLEFNREIRNRAAVERAIRVRARPAVEIRPHWFGRNRLDFRPEKYWKPGTKVTIGLPLRGVEAAPGVYGLRHRTHSFTVGRSQTSVVDAAEHTMRVRRDGELVATVPITAGAPKTTTYNGKMVVTEKLEVTRMNGATVGFEDADGKGEYDIPDVPHAMRLTSSGTFLHGNYWAGGVFGNANVSHGCVGLRDVKGGSSASPAGWFFDRSLIGDVVEVVHSDDKMVAPDNGLGGWNISWKEWKAGSAMN
ncbi:L,D-transpeptidase [Streptomyces sp. YC419]|uniref:L,D-transpeptidase n=2 Tax=Streptomyces ureilyticus TaxID=1775131 RepID=A0ABX0DKS6_9ACTN|nr:Ig-like domain-containing protein [Streptomyces ureilyticus]NGO42463.1 L,D-transpeptidase [Streptomyces ureilyticus]